MAGEVGHLRVQSFDRARRGQEVEIAGDGKHAARDFRQIDRQAAIERGNLASEVTGRLAVLVVRARRRRLR